MAIRLIRYTGRGAAVGWLAHGRAGVLVWGLGEDTARRCLDVLEGAGFTVVERHWLRPVTGDAVVYISIRTPPLRAVFAACDNDWLVPGERVSFSTGRPGDDSGRLGDDFMRLDDGHGRVGFFVNECGTRGTR